MYRSRRAPVYAVVSCVGLITASPAAAQFAADQPSFPTTEFARGSNSAMVTVDDLSAGISMVRRTEQGHAVTVPVLVVIADGQRVLESPGESSGFDFPVAEASIAEIDPSNESLEVYFTSFTGGAHCCSAVVVAAEVGGEWIAVPVGEFDGDGNFLVDLDKNGVAEIATTDNRFLYQFDCYACSVAPMRILGVSDGKVFDLSAAPEFVSAHRAWLEQIEGFGSEEWWSAPGYLAGWVAAKIRVGEGAEAWQVLNDHWDAAKDPGEEVCLTGDELEDCAPKNLAVLKFPDRLRLFLEQTGYLP